MNLLDIIEDKIEPNYIGGHVDKSEKRVEKREKVFAEQVYKAVSDMEAKKQIYQLFAMIVKQTLWLALLSKLHAFSKIWI